MSGRERSRFRQSPIADCVKPSDATYGPFAYAYDRALGERYFRAIRRLLDEVLRRYPPQVRTHLDVACGTGIALRFFAEHGFQSTGADLSIAMLSMARERSRRLVDADARALPFRGSFGLITCLYDSLNHMMDPDDLLRSFREIAALMSQDSLFVFDMNHPRVYPMVWGLDQPFVDSGREHHLEMATTFDAKKRTGEALITGWAILPGGERAEIRERQRQRSYEEQDILEALSKAGLTAVESKEFDPFREGEAFKLFYVCRKSEGVADLS